MFTIKDIKEIEINGLFKDKEGEIESWEKVKPEIMKILKESYIKKEET